MPQLTWAGRSWVRRRVSMRREMLATSPSCSTEDVGGLLATEARRQFINEGIVPELGHVVCVGIFVALAWGNSLPARLFAVGWGLAVVVLLGARFFIRRRMTHSESAESYHAFRIVVWVLALCWGVGAGLLVAQVGFNDLALVMVLMSALLSGAAITMGADRNFFRGFLAAMVVPLVLGIVLDGVNRTELLALVMIGFFAVFMFSFHARTHAALIARLETMVRLARSEADTDGQRARMEALLTGAPEAVVVVDSAGVVLQVNPRFEALFGFSMAESVGAVLNDLIVPESEHEIATELESRALQGEAVTRDVARQRRDGSLVQVHLSASRIADSSELFVIYQDVTEQLAARQAILDAWSAAERANQAKSAFLANMSHELRTPLNSVIGFANVLLRSKGANLIQPKDIMYIERIRDNGRHLLGLINSILDLSKVESGKLEVEQTDVSLGTLVEDTIAQLQPQVLGRPVTLVAQCPMDLPRLRTDAVKLKQVVINLVANALKFTEQGTVTVHVLADPATGRASGIEVRDTGIGIGADRLQAVFEAFQQADNTTSRRFGGTGLGLTITRALCELMGYTITLESTLHVGSTFRVLFGSKVEPPPSPVIVTSAAPRCAGRSVLVIDDESDSRLLLTGILEDYGCNVVQSGRGALGLAMARANRPDLITVDVLMPDMNGLEVIEALKNDPELADIPVAVVSVIASEQRNRAIGAVALIDKPIERAQIEALLRRHLLSDGSERLAEILEGLPVAV